MKFKFDREATLLRHIVRADLDTGLTDLPDWFDWDRFEEMVFRSRLVPLIAETLLGQSSDPGGIPDRLRDRLQKEREKAAVRTLLKERELGQILDEMNQDGIISIVLKGLPLAERCFGDAGLRDVRDLDILVAPEQLEKAEGVLRRLGYKLFEKVHSRSYYRRHHFHLVFVRRGVTVDVVELHWNLIHHPVNLKLDVSDLFRSSTEVDFHGRRIRRLSPVDEIVYMSASLRMSQFVSLRRLVDLDKAIQTYGGSALLPAILQCGNRWGIGEEVRAALFILHRFWGDAVPEELTTANIKRFASRFHGSDFFGVPSSRELRLRIWSSAFFGRHGPLRLAHRLIRPDEMLGSEIYYNPGGDKSLGQKARRAFTGAYHLLDLVVHLLVAPLRRPG